jgi:Protein of unknown function (DUF3551)
MESEDINMRLLASSLALAISIAAISTIASPAFAQDYKYCVQGTNAGYPGNCAFSTYAQCEATASGTNDGCGINPRFAYDRQRGGHHGQQAYRPY